MAWAVLARSVRAGRSAQTRKTHRAATAKLGGCSERWVLRGQTRSARIKGQRQQGAAARGGEPETSQINAGMAFAVENHFPQQRAKAHSLLKEMRSS